jgi:hypothetical protein
VGFEGIFSREDSEIMMHHRDLTRHDLVALQGEREKRERGALQNASVGSPLNPPPKWKITQGKNGVDEMSAVEELNRDRASGR